MNLSNSLQILLITRQKLISSGTFSKIKKKKTNSTLNKSNTFLEFAKKKDIYIHDINYLFIHDK